MFKTNYNIEESIVIKASMKKVWENISLFEKRKVSSPWLILDNKCKSKTEWKDGIVGTIDTWESPILGEWEMEITEVVKNESIKYELRFKKPFKSQAHTYYKITKTRKKWELKVTWWMDGSLPFFLFWMKDTMTLFIKKDFERGLAMLKVFTETGKLETSTQIKPVQNVKWFYWVGIEKTKPLTKVGETMMKDFDILGELFEKNEVKGKKVFAFYPKVDMKKNIFTFISSIQVSEKDFNKLELPKKFKKWYFEESKCLKVVHKWSYNFLSNSWTALYMAAKAEKLKPRKTQSSFEIYTKNFKDGLDEKDLVTDIYLPVK